MCEINSKMDKRVAWRNKLDSGLKNLRPIMKNLSEFKDEIASARTFSFLHELEQLLDANLIKGGDISNAIVYVDKE